MAQIKRASLSAAPASPDEGEASLLAIGKRFPAFGRALAFQQAGDYAKARAAFLDLIDQPALTPICLHQLAILAVDRGETGRAVDLLRQAIRIDPNQGLFYRSMGTALERIGDMPNAISALVDLGVALQKQEKHADSMSCYRQALALDPLRYGAWVNLATALAWSGSVADSVNTMMCGIALYGRLTAEVRDFANGLTDRLGTRLEGVARWRTLPPGNPVGPIEKIEDALVTLGKALGELGYPHEAKTAYELSMALAPGYALAHWNYSLNLLSFGHYSAGWREYEWRWQWDKFPEPRRQLPMPTWRGESLAGKRIYVFTEQGYGDALQFAPLVPRLLEQDAEIVFEVTTPLTRLFQQSLVRPGLDVVQRPDGPHIVAAEGRFDYVVPEMSLPSLLGLEVAHLPLSPPWIKVAPEDSAKWADLLPPRDGRKRVGLVWAGRTKHANDANRSVSFSVIEPLIRRDSAVFVSLQVGAQQDIAKTQGGRLIDTLEGIKDFGDTAALIEHLDLVIAVDTGVAHLAGSMGKPVWLLLPKMADWRWGWEGETTAWYPGHRLFRQTKVGDWADVMARIIEALET